jgi:SH3-like domain-containing protein
MKRSAKLLSFVICLLLPLVCNAQKAGQSRAGQIHCAHGEGYAYLYSSMATMEISTTLKCGQPVSILDRSDNFLHVRADTGEDGFVPAGNVIFVKPGTVVKAPTAPTKRELTHYDDPARLAAEVRPAPPRDEIILPRQTPVHLKLSRTLSSATAHVGEEVTFEVTQDVIVGGVTVIAKGASAAGAVTEAEPKKRMGKAGKLNVGVASVVLANNEKISLRSFGADQSADQKSGMTVPLLRGKDVTLSKDTQITAYVDDDVHLKVSSFAAARPATAAQSSPSPQN